MVGRRLAEADSAVRCNASVDRRRKSTSRGAGRTAVGQARRLEVDSLQLELRDPLLVSHCAFVAPLAGATSYAAVAADSRQTLDCRH